MSEFWEAELRETVRSSERLILRKMRSSDVGDWLGLYEETVPTTSNQGTGNLPFQRWFHFKEAFSPKFVTDTLASLPYRVETCLDPFLGSGTTSITCRMLGVRSIGVEVNPFLADLAEAKLTPVSATDFRSKYERVIAELRIEKSDRIMPPGMPRTLKQPGINERFVFSKDVFATARAIAREASCMDPDQARLLRVLLGSVLVSNSNVVINGKGRRYRRSTTGTEKDGNDLIRSLDDAVDIAIADLTTFSGLPKGIHRILRGDARNALCRVKQADAVIFSPPYPNSFDYTDVYNLELWMLGYLKSSTDNTELRTTTFRSHVQTKWRDSARVAHSKSLNQVVRALVQKRSNLWNRNIPEMVGYYFDDLWRVFAHLHRILKRGHHAVVAIGDSQYAGVHIDVAKILSECIAPMGFQIVKRGSIRSMRSSSQHGGKFDLSEHCLVFERI